MAGKKRVRPTHKSSDPFPYRKSRVRIPREMESAASLWLDFFQQSIDLVVDRDVAIGAVAYQETKDRETIQRARILADKALETFQDRFPGVHP